MEHFKELSLLYVEDDSGYIDLIIHTLRPLYGRLYVAKNGKKGVELFLKHRPDIILSDISMPEMDGIEMSRIIKDHDARVPIVMLSGMQDAEAITRAINVGIDGYLLKPIDPQQMVRLLTKLSNHVRTERVLIHERKLLEEHKKAVDASSLVSKTDARGVITYVNEAFCRFTGYRRDELIGGNHSIFRHPDTPNELYQEMWAQILAKQIWKGTLRNLKKNGSVYYVSMTIVPILDEHDEIIQFLSLRYDITEMEMHQLELERMIAVEVEKNIRVREAREEERLKAAKFLAVGTLAAGITHEINTPLTYMRGNLEMLLQDVNALEASQEKSLLQEDAESVMEGVNRIAAIVESMREIASQRSEQFERINIYTTLQTSLTLAYNRAKFITPMLLQGESFQLGMATDALAFVVEAQKQRLEQVWIIIINNALDVLQGVESFEKRLLQIDLEETPEDVVVTFTDNGGGINAAILPKIFDVFESSKNDGGMGIGLHLAKKIVEDHQGSLEAHNVDGGAQFTVRLPKVRQGTSIESEAGKS